MDRRRFLEGFFTCSSVVATMGYLNFKLQPNLLSPTLSTTESNTASIQAKIITSVEDISTATSSTTEHHSIQANAKLENTLAQQNLKGEGKISIKDLNNNYLNKISNFDEQHTDDIYINQTMVEPLTAAIKRLDRVQRLVGHGHFNIIGFDEMLKLSANYSQVGEFTRQELDFMEFIFGGNAKHYGFLGGKVQTSITTQIKKRDTIKVPRSGHYLFKGDALALYQRIHKDVGGSIILTSGVRSVVKQMHLFLKKTVQAEGNLSRASRSLAPPGHSYHAVGDFDVGKIGFGYRNFTSDFANTDEFKRLRQLTYVNIRYTSNNLFGVRFEPWHVKLA